MRSVTICVFLVTVLISIVNQTGYAQSKKTKVSKIAILQISSLNVPAYYSESIRNSLEYVLTDSGKFDILERQVIQKILNEKKLQNRKMSKVAKLLAADYLITGSIELIENYTLRIKVVSGETGKILFVYSQQFNDKNDYYSITKLFCRKIDKDIQSYTNKKSFEDQNFPSINLGLSTCFLYPLGIFSKVANFGYGVTINGGLEKNNYNILFQTGFIRYNTSNSIAELITIPVMIGFGYRININYQIYFVPYVSAGLQYIVAKKNNNTINQSEFAIQSGTYVGFNISSNTSIYLNTSLLYINESTDPIFGLYCNVGILYKI